MKLPAKKVDALQLARRVDSLKLLDRALLACKRLDDVELLHEGCALAWNIALPLLQPIKQRAIGSPPQRAIDSPSRGHQGPRGARGGCGVWAASL